MSTRSRSGQLAVPHKLTGAGRMLHESAVRDGQQRLAWVLTHLFGQSECPGCGSFFGIADEYAAAHAPAPWDFARGHTRDAL
ncbi:hypothetical protein [Streptomyces bottropensis]|uniref:hypothetical protein n=1 Tax=Streptomyces bottropensis TaxID=42235 RepID=UPI00369BF730